TVYDIGRIGDDEFSRPYFATEFVEGVTLKEHLLVNRLKLGDVLDIASQIASALVAAHAAGIIHRDIKPENIMVRRDGYIKVLDFGLAKPSERGTSLIDSEAETRAFVDTDPGTVMGTVSYMSPEQARGEQLDARTDIWSLGVVIYELVTGRVPFTGPTPSHAIVSLLENDPPALSISVPEVPEALELIVEEALRKDRDERIQTAKELLGRLRRLKQRVDAGTVLEHSVAPVFASDPSGPRQSGLESYPFKRRPITEETPGVATGTFKPTSTLPTSSAEFIVSQIKQHRAGALVLLLGVATVLIGLSFAVYKATGGRRGSPAATSMRMTRLTNSGRASSPVMSPDGKYAAHVLVAGERQSLVLRQTATNSSREIVPSANAYYVGATFSPDGNHLLYVRADRGQNVRTLYQVSVLGGDSRQLIYDVDSPVTFSPDGKKFAFVRGYLKEQEQALFTANADGSGEERMIVRRAPERATFQRPVWSPDGKTIAFLVSGTDSQGYYMNIDEVSMVDKTERKISTDRWRNITSIAWLADGSGLLASARDRASLAGSPNQIWHISYPDGKAIRITNDLNYYTELSIAAETPLVVATIMNKTSNIWIVPQGDVSKATVVPVSNFSGNEGVAWATDGRILFSSTERENRDIWISNPDGSNAKQLTFDPGADLHPSATPDGRYIVFESNRGNRWGIWRMNIDGSNPVALVDNVGEAGAPVSSIDSRWVIYGGKAANGKDGLWKVSIDGGTPVLLTEGQAYSHTISPDGKLIAYYFRALEMNAPLMI
ncbi:MAG TPA: protein kinase, partial [Pyrinomonadaceae bacterium]|nr:protein kinase [Pyrinomonadaceae bacterium]